MSERVIELFRTMVTGDLESQLQDAACQAGLQPLDDEEIRHLVRVMTSYPLVVTSLGDLVKVADALDTQLPQVLRLIAQSPSGEDEAMSRVLAVPDHVRLLGDKCLFEAGVARRRGPKGVDLEDLGSRSYARAASILERLGEDRRLRSFYEQNALDRVSLDEEVRFLGRCADLFPAHVRLLNVLLYRDRQPSPEAAPASAASARTAAPRAATALAPRHAPVTPPGPARRTVEDDDGPRRVVDLHLVSKTDEEAAQERVRELIAAEKTVLFSMLDPELLRTELKRVVLHQDRAIDSLCDEICLYATGTQDPRKPASYFLVGPTGVGKNHLVESLLKLFERLWGIEVPYLELEGPEFTYPSDINELKGAARGFIRSDEEGIMTKFHERAHDKPFSVILVDEVEKAHPQLRRFFLPIMDRGVMTDNRGRVLNFVNTTIFFTSNIGYSEAAQSAPRMGFGDEGGSPRAAGSFVEQRMRKTLSPEFINRVHVIHFGPLTRAAIDDIFELELAKIRRRYREAQSLEIDVTPAARQELLARGFHVDYGARNLAKVLNRWANIEVSKAIKRDEERHPSDAAPALEILRDMREGRRAYDPEQIRQAVRSATQVQVPYRRVVIDVADGELTYTSG